MDHDQRPPLPVSCAVLTDEPPGFWTSRQLGVWMQRGNPVISAHDVSAGDLARAELVCFELDEGERMHREHTQKVHESATKAASGIMPPLLAGARPPWA